MKKVRGPLSPLRFESPDYQRHFGDATAMIEMARATLRQIARDYMALCERQASGGDPFGDADDYRLLIIEQEIAKRCFEAVTLLFQTGGSSAGKNGHQLERYMRDMSFIMTHMGIEPDGWRERYGKLYFGIPVPTFG
jgi:3-hydroxy-9,10-secoandrosta-1,3,5(10)-triene-9,17-dione monooxygenase